MGLKHCSIGLNLENGHDTETASWWDLWAAANMVNNVYGVAMKRGSSLQGISSSCFESMLGRYEIGIGS